jgi:hypothetical protein
MSKLNNHYLEHYQNKKIKTFLLNFCNIQLSLSVPFFSFPFLPVLSYHPISSILFLLLLPSLLLLLLSFFIFSPLSSLLLFHLSFHLFNLTSLLSSPFLFLVCECVHVCCLFLVQWCEVCVLSTNIRFFFIYISR